LSLARNVTNSFCFGGGMKLLTHYVPLTREAEALAPAFARLMAALTVKCAQTPGGDRAFLSIEEMQRSSSMMVTVRRDRREPCSSRWSYAHEPNGRDLGGEHVYRWAPRPGLHDPETVMAAARDLLFALDAPERGDVRVHRVEFPHERVPGWSVTIGLTEPFFQTIDRSEALQHAREAADQHGVRCFIEIDEGYRLVGATGAV